ncbi:MAG: hypothetical protein HYZ75_17850 [Elusimicrobia bacterium]|nr:hypothetical protein [Elusimicrobiota bacterium]
MLRCLGVFRELQNSPGRETDDALILKAVLEQLEVLGVKTTAVTPEELDELPNFDYDLIIPMCEAPERIARLDGAEKRSPGTLWVNRPSSVLACYRTSMVPVLQAEPGLRLPPSELRSVTGGPGEPPKFPAPEGWWAKRGDVHNTCDHDVVRIARWSDASAILGDFERREIVRWVVQAHQPGDLVKFYGVGPGHWFTWFYHDPVRAKRIQFDLDTLAGQAAAGAKALGLEVFGGDAIISESGQISIIDLNSWPSFALVRHGAAVQISWHLQRRLKAVLTGRNK